MSSRSPGQTGLDRRELLAAQPRDANPPYNLPFTFSNGSSTDVHLILGAFLFMWNGLSLAS